MANLIDLFTGLKNNNTLIPPRSPSPIEEVDNFDQAPEPTEIRLIITVCQVVLNANINLDLVARQLVADDRIVGLKLSGVIQWGRIKTKSAKSLALKSKVSTRADFSNQCTIVVFIPEYNRHINLKIFGNGKSIITGSHSAEEAHLAVTLVKDRIRDLRGEYKIRSDSRFSDHFPSVLDYTKFVIKNHLILLKLLETFGLQLQLNLDLVMNKNQMKKYPGIDNRSGLPVEKNLLRDYELGTLIQEQIILGGSDPDIQNYIKIIQIINIFRHYFNKDKNSDRLLTILNDPNSFIHELIMKLYNLETLSLPLTYDTVEFDQDQMATVENYNTMFDAKFAFDREKLTQILNQRYLKSHLKSAKFEPEKYPAVNAKYVCRLECRPDCQSEGKKKNRLCLCKAISFLMFQDGDVIVTGARSWAQIQDGYQVISQILKDEYPLIKVENREPQKEADKTLPTQITKFIEGEKFVFLNKKQQIWHNPTNYYVLKNLGLLDRYSFHNSPDFPPVLPPEEDELDPDFDSDLDFDD